MVSAPRCDGKPNACSLATNSSSRDSPISTSGNTSRVASSASSTARPRSRWKRTSTTPAAVPRMVAPVADSAATSNDSTPAAMSASWCQRVTYQRQEKPDSTVVRRESLKLVSTSKTTGMNRKA